MSAANGTPIETFGERMLRFGAKGLRGKAEMKFMMADVRKPLAAVSAIVAAGNEVVFGAGEKGSFIRNPRTGEKVHLKEERGTYTMEVDPGPPGFTGQA